MRRILFGALLLGSAFTTFAQSDTAAPVKLFRPVPQARTKDHLLLQFGGALWQNKPDSIKTGGFSRTFNVYFMMDFPFKTSPKLSLALGAGLATDHVFLNKQTAGITGTGSRIVFRNQSDTTHYKKYKVSTAWLEVPLELRFSSNPDADGKSFKAALGLKGGLLLSAWTKGKNQEDRNGNSVNNSIVKEKDKDFFNSSRISATARIGYGHFTVFGSYAFTSLFKEGRGPDMNAMSIGLTLSGL